MDGLLNIWCRWYQPMQFYLRAGFSLPAQASFFLICTGGSMGAGYHPHVIQRPDNCWVPAENLIQYVKWMHQRPVLLDNFMFLNNLISRGYSWFLCFLKIFFMLVVSLFRLKLSLFTSALKEYVLWTLKFETDNLGQYCFSLRWI